MKKRLTMLALAAIVALSACSAAPGTSKDMEMAYASTTSAAIYPAGSGAMDSVDKATAENQGIEPAAAPPVQSDGGSVTSTALAAQEIGRKLIRNGYYSLETMDYAKTIQQIEALVNTAGGYIQSSETYGSGAVIQAYTNPRGARYVVRIPADGFFSFGEALSEIAAVVSSSQSTEEVTDYYYDTDARLKTLRVQEERLLTLMSQATELEAIIMLEQNLSDVRYRIESAEGTLRRLDSQVSFSTVSISVNEVFTPTKFEPVPVTLGERIAARFKNTLERMKSGAENLLVVLIGDAPQILLNLAIIAAIALVCLSVIRKIRARRGLDSSNPGGGGEDEGKSE